MRNKFDQLQYNIAAPVNDDDCEEEDEEDEDYASKKKDDFDSDDPVERRSFPFYKVFPVSHKNDVSLRVLELEVLSQSCWRDFTKFGPH